MKPSKEVFEKLLPGDFVKIKTRGQLIDTGWTMEKGFYGKSIFTHENSKIGVIENLMDEFLGELCRVRTVEVNEFTGEVFITLEEDNFFQHFTYEMMYELYPLTRGLE